jgi:hypothetical protein
MFDIRLSTETPDEVEVGAAVYGQIQIGSFNETFIASLSDWPPDRYRRQWLEAAERLVTGESKSAFVSSFVSPRDGMYFVWWPCYRVGEIVYVQNQLRFYEQLPSPFHENALYNYVADRRTVSEDEGSPISEWELPLLSIRDFLNGSAREVA